MTPLRGEFRDPVTDTGKIVVLINQGSGSVSPDAAGEVRSLIDRLGLSASIINTRSKTLSDDIDTAISEAPDTLVVIGGDGTAACALNRCHDRQIAVLPLPGGTMNLLHKSIHAEFTGWQDCLERALTNGRTRRIARGRVADHFFYIGATFGQLSNLSGAREAIREGDLTGAAAEVMTGDALEMEAALRIQYDAPGGITQSRAAMAIGSLIVPDTEGQYRFDVGVLDATSHLELMTTALSAMVRDWREVSDIDFIRTDKFELEELRQDQMAATLDGEPVDLPQTCSVQIENHAVSVLAAP